MNRPLLIVSGRGSSPLAEETIERGAAQVCRQYRLGFFSIPHLYHISESSRLWNKLADHAGKAILLCWMHPRPAEWLLRRHGIATEQLTILNVNSFPSADAAIRAAVEALEAGSPAGREAEPAAEGETFSPGETRLCNEPVAMRWYPVMDGSRCINCGHCLQFCLFGVYELDAGGRVTVRNPDRCKTGSPACSRICPQSAIMFPLYENDQAIAGAPGQYVVLDAAARKMFYARTKQPCPRCGLKAERQSAAAQAAGPLCPECGRPQPAQASDGGAAAAAATPVFDDLDALVDQLDQRMQPRR